MFEEIRFIKRKTAAKSVYYFSKMNGSGINNDNSLKNVQKANVISHWLSDF